MTNKSFKAYALKTVGNMQKNALYRAKINLEKSNSIYNTLNVELLNDKPSKQGKRPEPREIITRAEEGNMRYTYSVRENTNHVIIDFLTPTTTAECKQLHSFLCKTVEEIYASVCPSNITRKFNQSIKKAS